jgi:hypothetical protein
MAFGQQSGPPATARQVRHLTSLLLAAGHTGLRDARGALGLSQRQAGGRFTRDEADELIARLVAEAEIEHASPGVSSPRVDRREAERIAVLRGMSSDLLAAELQQRGWVVMEP